MGGSQRLAELAYDRNRTLDWESPAALEDLMKVLPFNEGHGDEFQAVGFAEVVDAQDVLLRNLAGKQELLFETLLGGSVRRKFRPENLQSNDSPQLFVIGLVHLAHASLAEEFFHAIASPEFHPGCKSLPGPPGNHSGGCILLAD